MNGAAGAAAATAVIRAIKASGVIVRVKPEDFLALLGQNQGGLVVHAMGGFLNRRHNDLMGHRGLAFCTQAHEAIPLPRGIQLVEAKSIWIP
jgi:hypothetical protein